MTNDLTLRCQIRIKPEFLRIDYEIGNPSTRGVYVFVVPTDARMEPYHHQTYMALSPNRRVLYLVVDKTPLPPDGLGLGLGKKEAVPLACFIKPGGRHSDRIMLYFPAREWHAYALPQDSEYGASSQVTHVVVSLGYVFEDEASQVERSLVPGLHTFVSTARRKLVATLRLDEPLLVQELLDDRIRMTF